MTDFSLHRRFVAALLVSTAAFAVAALVAPTTAGATSATTCGKQIVNDWYGDERLDKIYPLHCYREAIRSLGVDLAVYTGAEDDILRALSYAKRNQQDPGNAGDKAGTVPTETTGTVTGKDPGKDPGTDVPPANDTTPEIDTSGPSAVPLPLIVLAGFALLLLAAGGAGYLNRRAETRRVDGPDDLDD